MAIDDKMRDEKLQYDINHNLDGLFRGSFFTPPPPPLPQPRFLKLVRIMLETSNLARKYTYICSFTKYTF